MKTTPPTDLETNNENVKNVKQKTLSKEEFINILKSNEGVLYYSDIINLIVKRAEGSLCSIRGRYLRFHLFKDRIAFRAPSIYHI